MADGSLIFDTRLDASGMMKGVAVGLSATTAALTALGKSAVQSYAEYEQLVGGVETLFDTSSDVVMKYADNAYKTAGISANNYMETVTSFSASLLQGLGGDTEKAAQIADMAITDMADNANKMGTDMQSIQNAYQGFAKGNFTMLDNLKLGYGGTQTEMVRLINDSGILEQEISNINEVSFDQMIEAIHAVQTDMGITGTTAKEASTTIEGSVNSAKAAWDNLVTGIADDNQDFDQLIDNFVESVVIAGDNLIPRIQTTIKGIGNLATGLVKEALPQLVAEIPPLLSEMLPVVIEAFRYLVQGVLTALPELINVVARVIPQLAQSLLSLTPMLIDAGAQIVINLISGIAQAIPQLAVQIIDIIPQIVSALMTALPQLISAAIEFVSAIVAALPTVIQSLVDAIPTIIDAIINGLLESVPALLDGALQLFNAIVDAIPQIVTQLTAALPGIINAILGGLAKALPQILAAAVTLFTAIVQAIPRIIPQLVQAVPDIINTIIDVLTSNAPLILETAVTLFHAIVEALPTIIQALTQDLPNVINTVVDVLTSNLPLILQAAITLLMAIVAAIPEIIKELVKDLPQIIDAIVTGLSQGISAVAEVGMNLVKGLWNGINDMTSWIISKIKGFGESVLNGLKSFFGIHSPSKVMEKEVGRNIALGVIKGVDGQKKNAEKSAGELAQLYVSSAKTRVSELKKANKLTEAQEVTFWQEMIKHCKKGTKAYNTASAQLTTAKNTLKKDIAGLTKSYVKDVAEIQEALEKDIEELQKTYTDTLSSRTQEIARSLDLFSSVKLDDAVSREDLKQNLEEQVKAMDEWDSVLKSLSDRLGSDSDLYAELHDMDISSLETLKNINDMSEEELQAYAALYDKKQEIAKQRSELENAELRAQTDAQIKQLQIDAQSQIDSLKKTYVSELKKLGVTARKQSGAIGRAIVDGVASGLKQGSKNLDKTLKDFAQTMVDSVKKELDIHSPSKKFAWIGKMCLEGFDQEFNDFNPYDPMERAMKANKKTLAMSYNAGIEREYGIGGSFDYDKQADKTVDAFVRAGITVNVDGRPFGRLIGRYT